jgi:Ca2+-transporting ATPase
VSDSLSDAYRLSAEDVAKALDTYLHRGLTDAEAEARLSRYGHNELAAEAPVSAWRRFLSQFKDVLVILTAVSVVLWAVERDTALPYESIAIFAIVLLNAVMGFVQESRAEAAVTALRAMAASEAHVIRGGELRKAKFSAKMEGRLQGLDDAQLVIRIDSRVSVLNAMVCA